MTTRGHTPMSSFRSESPVFSVEGTWSLSSLKKERRVCVVLGFSLILIIFNNEGFIQDGEN